MGNLPWRRESIRKDPTNPLRGSLHAKGINFVLGKYIPWKWQLLEWWRKGGEEEGGWGPEPGAWSPAQEAGPGRGRAPPARRQTVARPGRNKHSLAVALKLLPRIDSTHEIPVF